jgi:hypothetical protein
VGSELTLAVFGLEPTAPTSSGFTNRRRLRFDGAWAPSREKLSMACPSGIRRSKPRKPAGSRTISPASPGASGC